MQKGLKVLNAARKDYEKDWKEGKAKGQKKTSSSNLNGGKDYDGGTGEEMIIWKDKE